MSINISLLKNPHQRPSGAIVAQCPACAMAGNDRTKNHLIVFPDGRFGCVANPNDKPHRKAIFDAVGEKKTPVRPVRVKTRCIEQWQKKLKATVMTASDVANTDVVTIKRDNSLDQTCLKSGRVGHMNYHTGPEVVKENGIENYHLRTGMDFHVSETSDPSESKIGSGKVHYHAFVPLSHQTTIPGSIKQWSDVIETINRGGHDRKPKQFLRSLLYGVQGFPDDYPAMTAETRLRRLIKKL